MPRINPKTLAAAFRRDPWLPYLLPANHGSFDNAQAELRWIRTELPVRKHVKAIKLRRHLVPLQYLLGSQPFHSLDILCEPGVLIPRWETEEWSFKLASLISNHYSNESFNTFIDLCTGTGCIPLLLGTMAPKNTHIVGVDISSKAIKLFQKNMAHNNLSFPVSAVCANVLDSPASLKEVLLSRLPVNASNKVDLITANPPYIPLSQYRPNLPTVGSDHTDRSVRLFEPQLALVGDKEFYTAIFNHAIYLNAKAVVCEVGDISQINHMIDLATRYNHAHGTNPISKWAWVSCTDSSNKPRSVVLWRQSSGWDFLEQMKQPSDLV